MKGSDFTVEKETANAALDKARDAEAGGSAQELLPDKTIALLAGGGATAHVFDDLAPILLEKFISTLP